MSTQQSLPLLDAVRVASPCPASWQEMSGDGRVRHCSICQQSVYDLSALTGSEAETLIRETAGRVCVRIHRREDGKVMTRDCPVGRLQVVRRRIAAVIWTAGILLFTLLGWLIKRPDARTGAVVGLGKGREFEPFRTIADWIDPPTQVMVGVCLPPPGSGIGSQSADEPQDDPCDGPAADDR